MTLSCAIYIVLADGASPHAMVEAQKRRLLNVKANNILNVGCMEILMLNVELDRPGMALNKCLSSPARFHEYNAGVVLYLD
jgi:hypothetical protein